MKKNINHSERHLIQLNMTEVCLPVEKKHQKLFESCVVEKFAETAENPQMVMNGSDWTLSVLGYWAGWLSKWNKG